MSVYTSVEPAQLEQFLARYRLGKLQEFTAIANGITNTNYYLDTETGRFVLTLYEHHSDDELLYMLGLQQHLVNRSVRCSEPVTDRRGDLFSSLNQRPAAIIHRLQGQVQPKPGSFHCAEVGAELARFHLAGQDYTGIRTNPRDIDWIIAVTDMLDANLSSCDRQLINTSLQAANQFDLDSLPQGAIHADLFHDNVLFIDNELGGILDFDYACSGSFVFDLAVLLNDWCIDSRGDLVESRFNATLEAYQQQRRLEAVEIDALPLMLCIAALRFWLSRLYDKAFPLSGELTFIKSPDSFRDMLVLRCSQQDKITTLLGPHQQR
jgi:homoserine kinase type II